MGKRVRGDVEKDLAIEEPYMRCSNKLIELHPGLFKDDNLSRGGVVKAKGQVLKEQSLSICRPPNISCRIQSFGRICKKFDVKRSRWVSEMGFGGLLHFVSDMHLPRKLAYWVMSRIDPFNKSLIAPDGRVFSFSKNQICWILGIPNGCKVVPTCKLLTKEVRQKVQNVVLKYGSSWKTKSSRGCGWVYTSISIPVTTQMMDRLEGEFADEEEEEFKTLFLIVALHMMLCPTQSPRLASDLLSALSCVMDCVEYDWCDLVLKKLMDSVSSFSRRFYANGFAGGCGGCAIFVVIFYLDRLDRQPVQWDVFPRIKVWNMKQIGLAAKADRKHSGDYGRLGVLDVAYGETHCRIARDNEAPNGIVVYNDVAGLIVSNTERRRCAMVNARAKRRTSCGHSVNPENSYAIAKIEE